MEFTGSDGIYLYAYHHEPNPLCPVCGSSQGILKVQGDQLFQVFFDDFVDNNSSQFKVPSFRSSVKTLYMQSPPSLEEATRSNLNKSMDQLLFDGDTLTVTDPNYPFTLSYRVKLE